MQSPEPGDWVATYGATGLVTNSDVLAKAELGRDRKPHRATTAVQHIGEEVEPGRVGRDAQAKVRVDLPGGPAAKAVEKGVVRSG
jgi:hypothetical protein